MDKEDREQETNTTELEERSESAKYKKKHKAKEHKQKTEAKDSQKKNSSFELKKYINWKTATAVLAILFIASLFTKGFDSGSCVTGAVSSSEAGERIVKFLGTVNPEIEAPEITSIKEESGIYKIGLKAGMQEGTLYTTKDGKLLIPAVYGIDTVLKDTPTSQQPLKKEIPKTDKPEINLFVMSQCPFGVQAEDAIKEVINLLKDKIDYNVRFIASDLGDGKFKSLHGAQELEEDLRQICIQRDYPAVYLDYLECVNRDYQNIANIWEQCASKQKIDIEKIKTCSSSDEAKELLSEDAALTDEFGVTGSPTLIINSVKSDIARSPEAYKQAVCSAFTEAPEECGSELEETTAETTAPATGSC